MIRDVGTRLDLHNSEVDQRIALAGGCGYEVLMTGQVCTLPARHRGPCAFVPRQQAEAEILQQRPRQ